MRNLFIKSSIAVLGAALAIGVGLATPKLQTVNADTIRLTHAWERDESGYWQYRDSNGKLAKGWKQIGGKWYYFDTEYGFMYFNCIEKIDNDWYRFTSSGAMYTGWYKDDCDCWVYFLPSGKMAFGWTQIGNKWYYFNGVGVMEVGHAYIDGAYYYFDANGAMKTGWVKITDPYDGDENWYYFTASGKMTTGWKQIGGKWYYFNEWGEMQTGTSIYQPTMIGSKIGIMTFMFLMTREL